MPFGIEKATLMPEIIIGVWFIKSRTNSLSGLCVNCVFQAYGMVRLKVLVRKIAISARVIERLGQYNMGLLLQPEVMPSL